MRRPAVLTALVSLLVIWAAPPAGAHPLGNFTVNRYAGVVLMPHQVVVHYVLDLAEIPAFQEEPSIDLDGDGVEEHELREWAGGATAAIADDLVLELDDRAVDLLVRDYAATMPLGQAGLTTLRLEATLSAPLDTGSGSVSFEDRNEPERLGWREITASGTAGVALVDPTVPAASVSDLLRAYPNDLLASPLSVTAMEAAFRPGMTAPAVASAPSRGAGRPDGGGGALAALIGHEGIPPILLGLVVAIAFGAWHALLPGHGKTLMAAAMVGSSARRSQAVVAGTAVALMHTFSVIALGLLVLTLETAFRPEALYPWLGMASGVAAVAIGAHLVRRRWASWRHERAMVEGDLHHDHDSEGHSHELPDGGLLSRRGIAALAFAGGILPAPSALIVMLAAIQGERVAYGLGLVLAFSLGLAVSLVVVGLGALRARELILDRLSLGARHMVPLASASAIAAVGLYVAVRGLVSF